MQGRHVRRWLRHTSLSQFEGRLFRALTAHEAKSLDQMAAVHILQSWMEAKNST
jgi:RNase H-fold protein (predicted Holliday junction resolvase)